MKQQVHALMVAKAALNDPGIRPNPRMTLPDDIPSKCNLTGNFSFTQIQERDSITFD